MFNLQLKIFGPYFIQTVENVACVLRNLSYRLENEIDPQEGADDVLDREWEMEQRREIEELDRSFTKSAPGCLAFLTRPRHRDNTPKLNSLAAMNRPIYNIDFANPGQWVWFAVWQIKLATKVNGQ